MPRKRLASARKPRLAGTGRKAWVAWLLGTGHQIKRREHEYEHSEQSNHGTGSGTALMQTYDVRHQEVLQPTRSGVPMQHAPRPEADPLFQDTQPVPMQQRPCRPPGARQVRRWHAPSATSLLQQKPGLVLRHGAHGCGPVRNESIGVGWSRAGFESHGAHGCMTRPWMRAYGSWCPMRMV